MARQKSFGFRSKKPSAGRDAQLKALEAGRSKKNPPSSTLKENQAAPTQTTSQPTQKSLLDAQKSIQVLQDKLNICTKNADNIRRTSQRRKKAIDGLKKENKELKEGRKDDEKRYNEENERIKAERKADEERYLGEIFELKQEREQAHTLLNKLCEEAATLKEAKKQCRSSLKAMTARAKRLQLALARYQQTSQTSTSNRLREKGKYTREARNLARVLVHAGCAQEKVGKVIARVGRTFGIDIPPSQLMSARTVGRCGTEALVTADMQIGYELAATKTCTLSQDSTSNRNINFEAHHIAMPVPDYTKGETTPKDAASSTPKIRLVRVGSTTDHSSETSMKGWLSQLDAISTTYNESPLAKRTGKRFTLRDFALKLKGMCGDHASGEKSTAKMIETWKHEQTIKHLGESGLLEKDLIDLLGYLNQKKEEKITSVGGIDLWEELSAEERGKHEADLKEEILLEVGMDAYELLSDTEREELDSFIWAGCCMHKFQNSFKGGNTAMMAFWERENIPGPIPLANKSNAEIIRNIMDPTQKGKPMTDAEKLALANTTRGGVKTMAVAGSILNNKDDKKGQGDSYQYHRDHAVKKKHDGPTSRFPDTSAVRINSHADGAGEILSHLDFYREFMNDIRDRKKKPGWTNLERNLKNALDDDPTLTELATMVLYTECITYPYIRAIRGPGTEELNVLDLGPLHERVMNHCQMIIDQPTLIIGPDVAAESVVLDGKSWKNPLAIETINQLRRKGGLKYLEKTTVAFFEGALETWGRFSAEFAPGGLIDKASAEERKKAWMPSTNDTNEGALGAFRVHVRNKPNTTLHQYNGYAVWERNGVEAFVDTMLNEDDDAYIIRKARAIDESGLERRRKEEIRQHEVRIVEDRRAAEAARKKKVDETMNGLRNLVLLTSKTLPDFKKITVKDIDLQLDAFTKVHGDKEIPLKTNRGRKDDKWKLLQAAISRFENGGIPVAIGVDADGVDATIRTWEDEEAELDEEMEPDQTLTDE